MSIDLRLDFLQRQASACRHAASNESDPVLRDLHLQNAANYLDEIKRLRSNGNEESEAA